MPSPTGASCSPSLISVCNPCTKECPIFRNCFGITTPKENSGTTTWTRSFLGHRCLLFAHAVLHPLPVLDTPVAHFLQYPVEGPAIAGQCVFHCHWSGVIDRAGDEFIQLQFF